MDPIQFSFRKGFSTEHAMHSVVKSTRDSFNNGNFLREFLRDLQEAFNSLVRDFLLDKLMFYGLLGTE